VHTAHLSAARFPGERKLAHVPSGPHPGNSGAARRAVPVLQRVTHHAVSDPVDQHVVAQRRSQTLQRTRSPTCSASSDGRTNMLFPLARFSMQLRLSDEEIESQAKIHHMHGNSFERARRRARAASATFGSDLNGRSHVLIFAPESVGPYHWACLRAFRS
jgi:hypothetical protein